MKNVWLNPAYSDSRAPYAIFADRDGTLIRHVDYIDHPDKVSLLPGVKESVQRLLSLKIPFFILTNQSGVGRGYFPIESVHACQQRLFELLGIEAEDLAGWCIAPEAPHETNGYRKPSPRFIREACRHLGIAPESCRMIGDTMVDLETGWNAGAQAWAVACGKPELPERIKAGQVEGAYTLEPDFRACVDAIMTA